MSTQNKSKYLKGIQTIFSENVLFHISLPSSSAEGIFSVIPSVLLGFTFQLLTRTEVF
jgi:hypothetical protein